MWRRRRKIFQSTKIGDTSYWGLEFFIFDQARYDQTGHSGYYFIDSEEGVWNMGKEGHNLGGKIRSAEGYFPVQPTDTQMDIRSEMILVMEKAEFRLKSITMKSLQPARRKSIFGWIRWSGRQTK
jgi:glutamine synthetase